MLSALEALDVMTATALGAMIGALAGLLIGALIAALLRHTGHG